MKKYAGFTLIELLLVITIVGILAVVVFVALNPAARLTAARDARRTSDVDTILSAIHQSIVDSGGTVPTALSTIEKQLGTATTGCATTGGGTGGCAVTAIACTDLSTPLAAYLKSIPIDPQGTGAKTGYSAIVDANGIVTIKACGTEQAANINASR